MLNYEGNGGTVRESRRATYVFERDATGRWLCVIDNSYGTDLIADDEKRQ